MNIPLFRLIRPIMAALAVALFLSPTGAHAQGPPAPANVEAFDRPWDSGRTIVVTWTQVPGAVSYQIERALSDEEAKRERRDARVAAARYARELVEKELKELAAEEAAARAHEPIEAAEAAAAALFAEQEAIGAVEMWRLIDVALDTDRAVIGDLDDGRAYRIRVRGVDASGNVGAPTEASAIATPSRQIFDGTRGWLLVILTIICGSVLGFIAAARHGLPLKVRQIAGLAAVDEAVGRATEMGRSVIFIPGIQDMNDIQTVAGVTILARVAQTAAEYDARVEVPTARSLVMTAARETVQASFLSAGRPEAFNPDLIYYVTDEQFGFVAYLSGMMVREKPAACFYMGSFFAESLILAETGNSIGAIQIAGTAQPAQLPFFVAACDYTLIGEEFFAASAYLSGEPDQLGSLKGQDIGKIIVATLLVVGSTLLTIAELTGSGVLLSIVDYIRGTMLG